MSLESAISDLVNSTNTLNTNVQNTLSTVNSQISALNSKIAPYNTTIQVGPGKQFTDLQSALNYATSSVLPIGSVINIQLADGSYSMTGLNGTGGYIISINGNGSDPTKVTITTSGIYLNNCNLTFNNLTFQDNAATIGIIFGPTTNAYLTLNNINFNLSYLTYSVINLRGLNSRLELFGNININTSNNLGMFVISTYQKCNIILNTTTNITTNGSIISNLFYLTNNSELILARNPANVTINSNTANNIFYLYNSKVNLYNYLGVSNININAANAVSLVVADQNSFCELHNVSGKFNSSSTNPVLNISNNSHVILRYSNINSTGVSGSYLAKVSNNSKLYLNDNTFTDFNTGIYAEINSTVDARNANTFTNVSNQFSPSTPFTYGNNNSVILA